MALLIDHLCVLAMETKGSVQSISTIQQIFTDFFLYVSHYNRCPEYISEQEDAGACLCGAQRLVRVGVNSLL